VGGAREFFLEESEGKSSWKCLREKAVQAEARVGQGGVVAGKKEKNMKSTLVPFP
jgi:hypothetical protein